MEVHLLITPSDSQPISNKSSGPKAVLPSQHWVVTDNETARKVKYIFRPNGDLVIAQVKEGKTSK